MSIQCWDSNQQPPVRVSSHNHKTSAPAQTIYTCLCQDDEIIVNYNYLYVFFYVNLPSMFVRLFPLAYRILVLKILFA